MEKTKLPSLVTVLILTLITVLMWVGFDIYRLFNQPVTPSVQANVSAPLTPTLDQTVINQIESRNILDDSQIPDNVINSSGNTPPQPSPEIIPTSKPISTPKNASGSGTPI